MGAAASVQSIPPSDLSFVAVPPTDPNEPLPFPKHGVHLSFANEFIAECGGRTALEGLTTTEVNDQFVKPATFAAQSSYCDMLTSQMSCCCGSGNGLHFSCVEISFFGCCGCFELSLQG